MLPADIPPLPPLPAGMVLSIAAPMNRRLSTEALPSTAALPAHDPLPHWNGLGNHDRSDAATSPPTYGATAERVSLRSGRKDSGEQNFQPPPLPADLMSGASSPQTRERSFMTWIEQCVPHPTSARDNAWAELDDIAGYHKGVVDELRRDIEAPSRIDGGRSLASWGTAFLSRLKQGRRALVHALADGYAGLQRLMSALRDFL